jgi:putative ABC transport system permease protein
VLAVGCLDGAIFGIYGHALATRYLHLNTGFPAPFSAGGGPLLVTLLIVAGVSLTIIAIAGYSATGVSTARSGNRDWSRTVA